MQGCSTCRILSSGRRLFVRKFSAPVASLKQDWHKLFEGYFGNSLPSRSVRNEPVGSATFVLDILEETVHNTAVCKKPSEVGLSTEELQVVNDVGLPQVFEHLIEELSVDHAILLCMKLPSSYLNRGIDTLIKILLERVNQNDFDVTDQDVLANKIFKLLKHSKRRDYTLSVGTSQSLQMWLLSNADALRCKHTLQPPCQGSMDLPEAISIEETPGEHLGDPDFIGASSILETGSQALSTRSLSSILGKVDSVNVVSNTRLLHEYYRLGRSASTGRCREHARQLQEFQQKGMPEKALRKFVDSFTRGLMEVHWNSGYIRKSVEAFKEITRSLNFNMVSSFNMLIAYCANHGEIDLCIELIQTMKARGLEPCASSYEPLIKCFARTLQISKAEDILKVMKLSGMQATTKAHESLIVAHAKVNNFERAYNLIEDVPCEDLTADLYTPIIYSHGLKGQASLAFSVFQQMKRRGIKPNAENFASFIRACAIGKHCRGAEKAFELYQRQGKFSEDDDKGVMAAMLRVYACCGRWEQVEKLISNTDADVLARREVASALLKGFADTGKSKEALQIYQEIKNGGGWPDSGAFCALLTSLGNAGELGQLLDLFEPFRKSVQAKSRILQEELMSIACSTIVHALITHNHLEGALTFLHRIQLEDAGDVETLCLKVFMEDKGTVPMAQRAHLTLKDKLQFLKAMREKLKIQPTRLAYESLLESCAKEKDAEHAEAVLNMMISDNLECNVFTYLIMLRMFIYRGDLKRATLVFTGMRQTMENKGLMDKDVMLIVRNIFKNGKVYVSKSYTLCRPRRQGNHIMKNANSFN